MIKLPKNKQLLKDAILIWLKTNNELREINKLIYEHTEFFENGYESNFDEEFHNFFAKKITRFAKEQHQLFNLMDDNFRKAVFEERFRQ